MYRFTGTIFLLALAGGLAAQTTADLEGVVRDPAGLPVSGAAVIAAEVETSAAHRANTDGEGRYRMAQLPAGSYNISAEAPGFKTAALPMVVLSVGRTTLAEFSLELGAVGETVEVTDATTLLSSSGANWGGGTERETLATTPMNGRDLFELAGAQRAARVTNLNRIGFTGGFGTALSMNGGRPNQNGFRVDGIQINVATGLPPVSATGRLAGIEAVQELSVVTSPFSAEYGRAASAVVSAISKSGGNQWHGSAYEYLRNNAMDARNYFDLASQPEPPYRRNLFGGMVSGPLVRNRLFVLVNPEWVRQSESLTSTVATPTEAVRAGVAPVAAPYVDLFPLPNGRDYGDGTAAFTRAVPTRVTQGYVSAKGDAIFSDRVRTAIRYAHDTSDSDAEDTYGFYMFKNRTRYHFASADTQYASSAAVLHNFRAGLNRNWNYAVPETHERIPASLSFVPGQPFGVLQITGLRDFGGNRAVVSKLLLIVTELQLNYQVLYTRGASSIKAGGGYSHSQVNPTLDVNSGALYVFGTLGSFLAGRPSAANLTVPGSISARSFTQHLGYAFVQYERRVSERLSLSGGLRYEPYTAPRERHDGLATMRFPATSPLGIGGPLYDNPSLKNFAPRVGLAWSLGGSHRTVFRAGFGMFHDVLGPATYVGNRAFAPEQKRNVTVIQPAFPNPLASLETLRTPPTLDMVDYDVQQPYVMQWQSTVEHQFGGHTVASVGYAGSRGVHLAGAVGNINAPVSEVGSDGKLRFVAGSPLQNTAFGPIGMLRSQFNLFYHALTAGAERRLSGGLRVKVRYTVGKAIDETSSVLFQDFIGADKVPNMLNYRVNRGRSDYDIRQAFSLNYSYQFPLSRGAGWKAVFSDWELDGLVQGQSGRAFNPKVGFDRAGLRGSDDLGQRPDLIAAGADLIKGMPEQYFDPLAFGLPAAGTLGNLGRNVLSGPGLVTVDAALHKVVFRTERQSLTLRLEGFNVTNRPNFQVPSVQSLFNSNGTRTGSAGQITETTTAARQLQIAARWSF